MTSGPFKPAFNPQKNSQSKVKLFANPKTSQPGCSPGAGSPRVGLTASSSNVSFSFFSFSLLLGFINPRRGFAAIALTDVAF